MGFLKFLKKGKKEDSLDKMDLPPTPPPLGDFDENIPDFPDFDEGRYPSMGGNSQKPDFPDMGQEVEYKTGNEYKTEEKSIQENIKDFPTFPNIEESPISPIEPIRAPPAAIRNAEPAVPYEVAGYNKENEAKQEQADSPKQDAYKRVIPKTPEQEKNILRQSRSIKEVYVRIDKFKAALGSINTIRSDLRKSEETLAKLESLKLSKDKSLDNAKSFMEDLHKKLIFIDKTLFKGE